LGRVFGAIVQIAVLPMFHTGQYLALSRAVYAVQLGEDVWVVHAFQKKSTQGIKTPKREIDLIRARLKRLQEMLP
jgi:phage-related protein